MKDEIKNVMIELKARALIIKASGLDATNRQAELRGEPPLYGEGYFVRISDEISALSDLLK